MPDLVDAGLSPSALGLFSVRSGGVSAAPFDSLNLALHVGDDARCVDRNRASLAAHLGLEPARLRYAEQVHGAGVVVVDGPSSRPVLAADALVTRDPDIGLVVLSADCLPVLLVDGVARIAAAAHAGRQGLRAGVLQATVAAMVAEGAEPSRMTAVIGPAVCGRCYELPEALARDVWDDLPGSASSTRDGRPAADLPAAAERSLRDQGLGEVRRVGGCTLEQPSTFFSFRRDGRTGRQAGAVRLGAR